MFSGVLTLFSNLSLSSILKLGRDQRQRDPLDYGPATMEMLLKDAVVRDFLDEESVPLPVSDAPILFLLRLSLIIDLPAATYEASIERDYYRSCRSSRDLVGAVAESPRSVRQPKTEPVLCWIAVLQSP